MKIAIHHRPRSFSDKWIEYCEQHNVPYKLVDCYASDIMKQMRDCDGLMWHWLHFDYKAINFARQLTYSLEHIKKRVFPNSKTCWHFDDKVGQKYLLEAINAPLVKSNVFYEKEEALEWAKKTRYPKVFKLRGGAGSLNVKMVKNKSMAESLIKKAFGKGFNPSDNLEKIKDRWGKLQFNKDINTFWSLIRGIVLYVIPSLSIDQRLTPRNKGYVYFQDFVPDNVYDIRVVIIGNRAFGIKRIVRKNDFKASGSGIKSYKKEDIPLECIDVSFNLNTKLNMQCVAYDFVFSGNKPMIVEISYGFISEVYPGYWDNKMNWHEGQFVPEWFMIEDFISELSK